LLEFQVVENQLNATRDEYAHQEYQSYFIGLNHQINDINPQKVRSGPVLGRVTIREMAWALKHDWSLRVLLSFTTIHCRTYTYLSFSLG